jgi:hypothetical protein
LPSCYPASGRLSATYVRRRRLPSGKILEERIYDDRPVAVQDDTGSGWGVFADALWFLFLVAVIWLIIAWWV